MRGESRRTAAGVLVHPDEAWQAVAAMAAGQVDAQRVGLAVVHLRGAFVDVCGQTEQKESIQDLLVSPSTRWSVFPPSHTHTRRPPHPPQEETGTFLPAVAPLQPDRAAFP